MTTEKQAFSFKKLMTDNPVATMAAMTAVPTAVAGGLGLLKERNAKKHHENTHRSMLELYPGLKRHKPEAKRLHGALHSVNQSYAGNPTIAGAWVGNVLQSGKDMGLPDKALLSSIADAGGQRAARGLESSNSLAGMPADIKKGLEGFQKFEELQGQLGESKRLLAGSRKSQSALEDRLSESQAAQAEARELLSKLKLGSLDTGAARMQDALLLANQKYLTHEGGR